MKAQPVFLGVEQVLAIHHRMVKEFGGSDELRDYGLLESAVMMPAAQFGGQFLHDGLPAMAAAYLFHICKNHAFADGNKRAAAATAETFLMLNGLRLKATNREFERLTLGVADGTVSKDDAVEFFRRHAG